MNVRPAGTGPRDCCGSCGFDALLMMVDLGHSPIANTFAKDPNESETQPRFPLRMVQCAACRLTQIADVVPDELLWSDDFGYYSSTSAPLLSHFASYAAETMAKHPVAAGRLVVEVGCNDGILLRHFANAGHPTLGVDPAKGPAEAARGLGLEVITAGFTRALARSIRMEYGPAALVLANNVAAHVSQLGDFLGGLRELLADDGALIMEVQNFDDLWLRHGLDMLYHEHRFFYSERSLASALRLVGLDVKQIQHVDTQGGSLRVTAVRTHIDPLAGRQNLDTPRVGFDLQPRADLIARRLNETLAGFADRGLTIGGYGAPAKATTLLHWTGAHRYLSFVADTTPAKIGRYMPGTRVPIIDAAGAAKDPPDVWLLTSWNYASSILRREAGFIANGGRFVIPLPVPMVI